MAVRIIDGNPGSGKSFYAVHHLVKSFYEKQDDLYIMKPGYKLIANIDNLKLPHDDLRTLAQNAGGYEKFFSLEHQKSMKEEFGNIVYFIDEAQMIFRRNFKAADVFSWFEYHRHLGQDIYLITQNIKKLPPDINTLSEYVVHACPRIRSLTGEFRYHWISDKERLKTETLRPNKNIFALYKSMDLAENEKIKNPMIRTALITFLVVGIVIFSGFKYIKHRWGVTEVLANDTQKETVLPGATTVQDLSNVTDNQGSDINQNPLPVRWTQISVARLFTNNQVGEVFFYDGQMFFPDDFPFEIKRLGRLVMAQVPAMDQSVPGESVSR